ncbi:Oidioi.mRNA.OKI2018_I69.chr2.g5441.t1.cds [Oikopleura dioica]|uniref:Oidioi.mRNA.OKI2018_I69.chr2.g5441.t1.cds n=1 Tax=Oikopleura dioica TaxID=34765 RepID=A0ABN7SZX4_OIKDI|nr:Oidioi.mRNA.OKI2018_I69.chr2.g5441.t1.cds [Oikopleura dioica]
MRGIMIFTVGTDIYSNDASSFTCSTKQPLCNSVCFNQFMPMNLTRFWTWHMVALGITAVAFVTIVNEPSKDLKLMRSLEAEIGNPDEEEKSDLPPSYQQIKLNKLKAKYSDINAIAESYKGRKMIVTTRKTKIHRAVFQMTLLGLELVFFIFFLSLLKHQYHYKTGWWTLLTTGKLFQTPASFSCVIDENSLTSIPKEIAQAKNFNSTDPRYFFWKAKHACSQAESVCNVARFTEKTYITYFMLGSNALAIIILVFNGIFILGQTSVIGIKRGSSWVNQKARYFKNRRTQSLVNPSAQSSGRRSTCSTPNLPPTPSMLGMSMRGRGTPIST